ncbi:galactokinase [Actinomadura fulvescens]|uniref:Galactokinase n=1 Tax=Actinomadura fulvescens TaxID=46160 RepID=A0ABP6D6Q1_9ACTN
MTGVWYAPGRINLIGEHTDYNGGLVLPFALGSGVTVSAARRDDRLLVLRSAQLPGVVTVPLDELSPGRITGWAAYPAGVAGVLRAAGYPIAGATLSIDSDLPRGAGLSSSAALECATALALTRLYGLRVPRTELARYAQQAEHEYAGTPCGIMDQAASLLCTEGHALLMDCASGATEQVPLDLAGHVLLLVDTRSPHVLSDGGYARRRGECEEAARLLGVSALSEVTEVPAALPDPVLRRRTDHVVTENDRVRRAIEFLRAGDAAGLGRVLTASHRSLRDLYEVSWPAADVTVDTALDAGALGGRMIGGGFGGSVLLLATLDRADDVAGSVSGAYAARGLATPVITRVSPGPGAYRRS